ncbi:hypothetical protein ABXT00_13990 [Stenotrophomonas koreensis]|uniref:hypothetical protein n=1 Tax=Stenotrophomonas koreensis TaxID=266128 RepID=UPI00339545A6
MKIISSTFLIASALGLASATLPFESLANPQQISSTTTTTLKYLSGSPEIDAIYAWIREKSPEHGPLGIAKEISITNTETLTGRVVRSSPGSGPPVPLPASGSPGQTITIMSSFPNGGFESWTYTWQSRPASAGGGGAWVLSMYEYKKGNLNPR